LGLNNYTVAEDLVARSACAEQPIRVYLSEGKKLPWGDLPKCRENNQ